MKFIKPIFTKYDNKFIFSQTYFQNLSTFGVPA